MSTCKLPFGVKIEEVAKRYPQASYEPELAVGLVWRFEEPKAALRIHTTGSINVTGSELSNLTCFISVLFILSDFIERSYSSNREDLSDCGTVQMFIEGEEVAARTVSVQG
jgi:hypothetical protein